MPGARAPEFPDAPIHFGLSLVGAGTVALAIAVGEYVAMERYLWSREFAPIAGLTKRPRRTPTLFVALVLVVVGAWAFAGIAMRLG